MDIDLEALRRAFDEDGFVALRGYLRGPALDRVKSRTVALMDRLGPESADRGKPVRPGHEQYATIRKNLQDHDPWAYEFLHHGPHVPIVEALVGNALHPASFGWFGKRPQEADRVAPHFDAVGNPDAVGATLWIALDPASRESGCLHYLRGSHKRHFEAKLGLDVSAEQADTCVMEAEPGDAFIHSGRTVHWSHGNRTDTDRRALALFYWSKTSAADSPAAKRGTAAVAGG